MKNGFENDDDDCFFLVTVVFRNRSERKIPDIKKWRHKDLRPLPSSSLVTLLN